MKTTFQLNRAGPMIRTSSSHLDGECATITPIPLMGKFFKLEGNFPSAAETP